MQHTFLKKVSVGAKYAKYETFRNSLTGCVLRFQSAENTPEKHEKSP